MKKTALSGSRISVLCIAVFLACAAVLAGCAGTESTLANGGADSAEYAADVSDADGIVVTDEPVLSDEQPAPTASPSQKPTDPPLKSAATASAKPVTSASASPVTTLSATPAASGETPLGTAVTMVTTVTTADISAETPGASAPTVRPAGLPSEFAFVYKGAKITMDAEAAPIKGIIGEPSSAFEAPSCAFNGVDRILYYDGIIIYTYPGENDIDRVSAMTVGTYGLATPEGFELGQSVAEMEAVYGNGYVKVLDMYIYTVGMTELSISFDNGEAADITYNNLAAQ